MRRPDVSANLEEAARARSGGSRRRKPAALAVSALFHVGLCALFLESAEGEFVTGAAADGAPGVTMEVALVSASGLGAAAAPMAETGAQATRETHFRMIATSPVSVAALEPKDEVDRLLNRLAPTSGRTAGGPQDLQRRPTSEASRPASGGEGDAAQPGRPSNAAAKAPTPGAASSGDLWGRVEPCWKGRATRVATPVVLSITLDPTGRLTNAPVILRDRGEAVGEARLRAEASALAALALCLPEGDPRFGGKTYQLRFEPNP